MARELAIQVTAETTQAEQALGRVETQIQGISGVTEQMSTANAEADAEWNALAGRLRNTETAFGAVSRNANEALGVFAKYGDTWIARGGFGVLVSQVANYADKISDLSKRTGIGVEALQRFEFVAKTNGSSLEAVALAAQRLGERLSSGDKSAVAAMNALGLSVSELIRMSPEDRFRKVAEALTRIEDPAKKGELAMDAMGRSGLQLVGVLDDLGHGADRNIPVMSKHLIAANAAIQDTIDLLLQMGKVGLGAAIGAWPMLWQKSTEWAQGKLRGGLERMGMVDPALPKPNLSRGDIELPNISEGSNIVPGGFTVPPMSRRGPAPENPFINPWMSGFLNNVDANQWAAGARGPVVSGMLPFAGNPWQQFPGWAPIQTTGWQPPMAPLAGTVEMNAPNLPGPSMLQRLTGAMNNPLAQFGLGQMMGLLPGMSGQGSSVGSGFGAALGATGGIGQALGGFASFLGPVGGLVGGLIGKLFGPSEKSKTQKARGGFVDDFGGMDALKEAAERADFSLDRLFSTKKVKDFENEVKKLGKAIDEQEKDAQRLENAMQRYGLTLQQAGAKFKQAEMNKGFKELGEDFRVLLGAGFQFNDIAQQMAPAMGALIHESIEMGVQVPRELEPIIRKMIEMGMLVDKNGDKFTDLAQVPFAESLTQGFDRVVAAINRMTDAFNGAAGAAGNLANTAGGIGVGGGVPGGGGSGEGGGSVDGGGSGEVQVSRGGIIMGRGRVLHFRSGGFVPHGTDTVPAMLTPGEMVIARDSVESAVAAMNVGAQIITKTGPFVDPSQWISGPWSPIPNVPIGNNGTLPVPGGSGMPSGPVTPIPNVPITMPGGNNSTMPIGSRTPVENNNVTILPVAVEPNHNIDSILRSIEARLSRRIPNGASALRGVLDQLYTRKPTRRRAS
jgi:hypothetical protein